MLGLDKTFVGTEDYMGMGYFWNYEYRHYMRDMSYAKRRRVHKKLLAAGLDVRHVSARHESIILTEV